jgi:photosystem II stability/assembly factor-like uncharacterized protein
MTRWSAVTAAGMSLALAAAPGPAPRFDAWRVVGPGGGGTTLRPTISPHDPSLVVEGCDMTGAYITHDAGASWRMFNLGDVVSAYAFDPKDPKVVYAGTGALWRSDDAGRSWRMVWPDPAKNTVEHGRTDHADQAFSSDDPSYPSNRGVTIHAIAVDPADPTRIYAAFALGAVGPPTALRDGSVVIGSTDRGRSWSSLGTLGPERVFALSVEGDRLLALAETGAWEGAGTEWKHFDGPAAGRFDSGSIGHGPDGPILYGTTKVGGRGAEVSGGIQVSIDRGRTWRTANTGLLEKLGSPGEGEAPELHAIAASARHGLTAYVGFRRLRSGPGPAGLFNGVAKTTDGGQSWRIVHRESNGPAENMNGSWIEERARQMGRDIWYDAPYDIAAAPNDPDICYVTDLFRTYRTLDGGRTWDQVHSAPRGTAAWTSRGLDVTSSYGVHFDPFDTKRLFITYTDIGLFRSEDGGDSWIGSTVGIPNAWRNTTYWVAFDPEVKGRLWGAFSGTHDLPRPKMWRRTDPDTYKGGVGVSADGGRSWTLSNTGMAESAVTHVLLDPSSPKGARTLYACAFGRGLYKSTDDGKTWALKNDGLTQRQPFAWRISRAGDGTLYLVVARRSERGKIGDEGDGALYRSTDGAEHWTPMALPRGTNGPNALTVDPRDPRRLYLSAWGVAGDVDDSGGGLFLSTDAGATWRNVLPRSQHVYDTTVDPARPDTLYACGFDQAAWRSTDRGETWSRVRGFNFKWGHRVIPDAHDASSIYVTTFGGSVWHGPAAGDPQAPEDAVRVPVAGPATETPEARREKLVEANIRGVHAYQVLLARQSGRGDPACFGGGTLTEADLKALVAHQSALLGSDLAAMKAWVEAGRSGFDPTLDVEPLLSAPLTLDVRLPVEVFTRDLAAHVRAPRAHVRAIANLYQTILEVERDGDLLQQEFDFDIALGLPVFVGQLGRPGTDADFLATGRALEGLTCASPVGTSAAEWEIAGRKIWNWGEKKLHIRDEQVVAKELLQEPEVRAFLPRLRAVPAEKVAVIGHSFTMGLHWSSPGSFVTIATAMLRSENPGVQVKQFQGGGLTASRALKNFYEDARAWKPDAVLLVVLTRTDDDVKALDTMVRGFTQAGAKVYMFDSVRDPEEAARLARQQEAVRAAGGTLVEVAALLAASPDRARFPCLDGIHMTEPYHRLMAKEWLKLLAGVRGPKLVG